MMSGPEKQLSFSDIPMMTIGQFMLQKMGKYGENTALVDSDTGKEYTYNDVISRSERLAAGLQMLGVEQDDVIAIVSPNSVDYPVCFYAVTMIAAVFQPINPLYTTEELNGILARCGTRYIITQQGLVPKVRKATAGNDSMKKIIVFGEADGCVPYDSLLDPRYGRHVTPVCDPKTSTAALFSSSGTTGFPKAVQLSHYALVANLVQIISMDDSIEGAVSLLFLPMFHIFGLFMSCSLGQATGAKTVVISRFAPQQYLQLIQRYKPRTLVVVPPIMVMFAKHPNLSQYDLSSVKTIMSGAAPLSEEVERQVQKKLDLNFIKQGYGMTEVLVTHANTDKGYRQKAVGRLLPLVEMKIVDVDTGKPVHTKRPGEIWIRGPQTAMGYLNMPVETKETFLPDGWVRTGDIGYEDEDGFLFIVDRLKELIKYKGFQVAPATLEDILLRHNDVADVGVIGVPDDEAGELPRAFVVRKPGRTVSEQALVEFVRGHVAPHMRLRGGVRFLERIPRSQAGKILRRTLRDIANSKL